MKLEDKVAVVTGGGSGIGRAAVLALAQRGAKIVVADIDNGGGRRSADMVREKGGAAVFTQCDVGKTEDLEAIFAAAVERFARCDIVFNNAGVGGEDLFGDDAGNWKRLIAIDLTAIIDATRVAVREMKRAGRGGVIINTASLIGLGPMAAAPVYTAAKAGVVNFSRSLSYLATEANIRVNTICPELVDTPMAAALGKKVLEELRRAGGILKPEDIAAGVVELIENDSCAGAVMRVTVRAGRELVTF